MAIKKLWITDDCVACGSCESICPEVFEVKDKSTIKPDVDLNQYEPKIKEAANLCPANAIKYE
ncbi:MAG: ferredoxin [Paludibacteraceae bacterium]